MKTVKSILKTEKGFTLIEMMIVLVIISVLLLIVVPNLSKNQIVASDKGCEATIELIKTQVVAYQVEHQKMPKSLDNLKNGYVERTTCPDGTELKLVGDQVKKVTSP
ncbi:prepilin-type N-terminal cleavage/methylation domain-containing protein [Salipaludibacillus sp. LMS25]|uniref:competence type IV pilus major pilin ComGC n=1 Tax=Salipaludibacillus sp. LMS25 TaxID=2924031 RepID=UPI0020D13196|nr:competence type IV pilus major pilin ComGC [Salipaludibacillus sp. LMS25]UTR14455.1 prepilin-type N-terminal cleavage/methylation domain-containing protein [Salipaludibacillus sp. LMS25]